MRRATQGSVSLFPFWVVREKRESLQKFSAEVDEAREEEKRLQNQLVETREGITKFDVAELESARKLRDDAFISYFDDKHELEGLEGKKKDLALRVDELKERLDYAQKKIERKEKIDRLHGIIERIRGAYRSI
jgi:chromosome segregation ATPase